MSSKKIRPIEVAKKWGIPHIIDVEDHDKWKLAFMQLGAATVMLEKANVHIEQQEKTIDALNEELQIFLQALDHVCKESNFVLEEALEQARVDFDRMKQEDT